MSQTKKILKRKAQGFTLEQIAIQLGLSVGELKESIHKENHPLRKDQQPEGP